jgi:hypothetical protein
MKNEFYINRSELSKVSKLLDKFSANSCRLIHNNDSGIGSTLEVVLEQLVDIDGVGYEGTLSIIITDHTSW